jgi:NitT/TauT family transport system substrate-binding protein
MKSIAIALAFVAALASTAQAQSVKFAWSPNPQTPQVDIAIKNGLFKDAGLTVQTIGFPSGREALEALIGGQVDFAYMAEFPVATAALRKQPLKVIADLARYKGQSIIANAKFLDLKTPSDLAGKKIGTVLGTNVEFFTYRVLTHAGIKATIINAGPSDLVPALVRGDADAIATFPTFFGAAKKVLGENEREIVPGDYVLHMIVAASDAIIAKDPAAVDKFVAALVRADAVIKADPDAAEKAVLTDMRGMMPAADLHAMSQETDFSTRLDPDLLTLISDEANWIVDRGMVKTAKPSVEVLRGYVDETPLKHVAPGNVTLP